MPNLTAQPDDIGFPCEPGESVLAAALRAGLPFTHACGGRARCSTCRIRVLEGDAAVPAPEGEEAALRERLKLAPDIRLACQFRPEEDIAFRRLVIDEIDVALANQLLRAEPARAGEQRDVSILFFDVADFTELSARFPPYDLLYMLNRFYTRADAILARHGGYFDKAVGDGFIAIFGMEGDARAPLHAVAAALELLAEVERAAILVRRLYGVPFDARIGLDHGEALIGSLGPAGAEHLTALGSVVNIASRVEQANKEAGSRLLVTDALHAHVAEHVTSPDYVRVRLRGTAERHTLHEVTELTEAGRRLLAGLPTPERETAPARRSWVRMIASEDLPEGGHAVIPGPKRDVVVARLEGRLVAFNNACPHMRLPFFGAPTPPGGPFPDVPPCSAIEPKGALRCRWHGSEFDLASGDATVWCARLGSDGLSPGMEFLGDVSKNHAPLEVYPCLERDGFVWAALD